MTSGQRSDYLGERAERKNVIGPLLRAAGSSAVVLRNRHKPGRTALLDDIVVDWSGIWVIDVKVRPGPVEIVTDRDGGDMPDRLIVDGHDRIRDIDGLSWQFEAVSGAIDAKEFGDVPIVPVLCYLEADWSDVGDATELCRVLVGGPEHVVERLLAAEPVIDLDRVHAVADQLDHRLPAAELG